MAFSLLVVGCLVKKGLQKGGSRAPQDPPGYAFVRSRVAEKATDAVIYYCLFFHDKC